MALLLWAKIASHFVQAYTSRYVQNRLNGLQRLRYISQAEIPGPPSVAPLSNGDHFSRELCWKCIVRLAFAWERAVVMLSTPQERSQRCVE